uniref:Uncharacterized protein n=2 Tax=Setaria TaxID=4554 RepID=A0A4U6UQ81_SETVI|nr:hypothetical protein SEVIR_5G437800v2 [Setaria viridis]
MVWLYFAILNSSGCHCNMVKKSELSTLCRRSTIKSLSGDNCSFVISSAKARRRTAYGQASVWWVLVFIWISCTMASIS